MNCLAIRVRTALLAIAFVVTTNGIAAAACDRIVAIGDQHGGYDAFVSILRHTELIDESGDWIGGNACLVQVGDLVDRGDRSREILDLVMKLDAQAGDQTYFLLGNHEVMNLVGDLRYVSVGEYAAFADDETKVERDAGFDAYLALKGLTREPPELRLDFDREHPPGYFAHRRAFAPDGHYGSWLLDRDAALALDGLLFVHGGIVLADAELGLEKVNQRLRQEMTSYIGQRARMIEQKWLNPLSGFRPSFDEVEAHLLSLETEDPEAPSPTTPATAKQTDTARQFLALRTMNFPTRESIIWNRDLPRSVEEEFAPTLTSILSAFDVRAVIVGHTPQEGFRIESRFDNRVFIIDTGAGPTYGGRPSALEIDANGKPEAVYLDQRVRFPTAGRSDEEIEQFLLDGKVVESKKIGTGVTMPTKLKLTYQSEEMSAAFKAVAIEERGLTRRGNTKPVMNFADHFRFERAAYLLDRELDMNLVPVAVLRQQNGTPGAVVEWVDNSISHTERTKRGLEPPNLPDIAKGLITMRVFDALIGNMDRNTGNYLYVIDGDHWSLHLIDHTRCFRFAAMMPEGYEARPLRISRTLHARLKALDGRRVTELLDGLVSKVRCKALMDRRDLILEKIEADTAKYGEAVVFHD